MKLNELIGNFTEDVMLEAWQSLKKWTKGSTSGTLSESVGLVNEQILVDGVVVATYNKADRYFVFEADDITSLPADIKMSVNEARRVWSKQGDKIVRKYRCTSGIRKGRIVSDPATCNKPIDIQKRINMRKTRARKGQVMDRKARRSKRINPVSKQVARLNNMDPNS